MNKGDYILLKCECGATRKVKGHQFEYQCPKCREPMWNVVCIGNYERDRKAKAVSKELTAREKSLHFILTGEKIA